ncbi:branched-chain-amino-acid aminotransferase 3, chloroplastic-like [Silene latifolia]|uniref:branched-chain-amino-acid aminotransferase 3, chloroplastic-like n=1 Tax=Silene latifolia TaxID=37657 RepID=UPI003D780AB2
MKDGPDRMCMPYRSVVQFGNVVEQTALANQRWIRPPGKGSLYLRPLILGTGSILGLTQAPEYTFLIYTTPVSNYLKDGVNSQLSQSNNAYSLMQFL